MSAALEVAIRRKDFASPDGPRAVLGEIAFACPTSSFTVLTGPSGTGKTTLLNLVAGLDAEFEGRIRIGPGERLAYVFQEPRLLPWRTVEENIRLAIAGQGMPVDPVWIDRLLGAVGLADARHLHPTRLSLGMARRAALARAFAIRPTLLLMDEPFVSLDEPTAERLRDLLTELLAQQPATILFVTHDLREAVRLGRRLLVLGGSPARLVADLDLALEPAARRDRVAVELYLRELRHRLAAPLPGAA